MDPTGHAPHPRRTVRRFATALAITLGALAVASCTSGVSTAGSTDVMPAAPSAGAGSAGGSEPETGPDTGADSASSSAQHGTGKPAALPVTNDRQVIKSAQVDMTITVQRPQAKPGGDNQDAADRALATAVEIASVKVRALAGSGGYVGNADSKAGFASITLRIPTSAYPATMTALAKIGVITSQTETVQDVTAAMIDLSSRLDSMKASVARIRTLMQKAEKISDIIAIESELAEREGGLESLERQQAALADQVALSTITVALQAQFPGEAQTHAKAAGFVGGLAAGWGALRAFGRGLATVCGALLPFLPVIAILIGLAWWLRRRLRRSHPSAPVPPVPAAPTPQ